jgi:hypothetical protein
VGRSCSTHGRDEKYIQNYTNNSLGSIKPGNFLTSRVTVSFLRRILLRGVGQSIDRLYPFLKLYI